MMMTATAAADSLVQIEFQVQILPLHDLAVYDLLGPAFRTKSAKCRIVPAS